MGSVIEILDEKTVNKIAAGEVIERPLSVVKELVENSIDAGATSISVELKGGGIDFIRVTDNGSGIAADYVKKAFLPHATSKIHSADDLFSVRSLGFRGEALSTIAAVCQTEIITKTKDRMTALSYRIDGGKEVSFDEIGAPDGTTFIARNLFFHTPARRKFLKTAMTEAGYVTEFMQHMAINYADIAFKYIVNNVNKLVTTGNGDRRENIYKVYGREIADSILEFEAEDLGMSLRGYAAKPVVARSSREYEIFFVNGHFIKDKLLEKAVEEAYKPYLMQHRFPFCVLVLNIDPGLVDVNVHPKKTEMKFAHGPELFEFVRRAVGECLSNTELINKAGLVEEPEEKYTAPKVSAEPFEVLRTVKDGSRTLFVAEDRTSDDPGKDNTEDAGDSFFYEQNDGISEVEEKTAFLEKKDTAFTGKKPVQLDLFEEKIIKPENKPYFRLVGQVFKTYWIIEYKNKMFIIDQHAAHEKVMYERFVKQYKSRNVTSQLLSPALILTLNGKQEMILERYMESFRSLGFEIEHFEGADYAVRAVPSGFMKLESREIFTGLIDELGDGINTEDVEIIHDRLAQMSCKAAVKGNTELSFKEADELLTELLSLENPYNCPHGRPTMIEFTERELEKKFKRIV